MWCSSTSVQKSGVQLDSADKRKHCPWRWLKFETEGRLWCLCGTEQAGRIMDVNRIFCAEQITVPPALPDILKDFTKAVIREDPSAGEADPAAARMKLYQWSRDYFKTKLGEAQKS
eukprot:s2317_g9.t1